MLFPVLIKLVPVPEKKDSIRLASARLLLHKWWCARHKQSCAIGWMELGDLDWSRAEQARLLVLLQVGRRCSCRASKQGRFGGWIRSADEKMDQQKWW